MTRARSMLVEAGALRFVSEEMRKSDSGAPQVTVGGVEIAAIGTTASRALAGALLAEALEAEGLSITGANAHLDPDALFSDPSWRLGIVLSPWKLQIGERCGSLARSAEATGVVDTVLRTAGVTVGFNTNTWAALSALEVLSGDALMRRILILGAGASARSVALAIGRGYPDCEIVIAARSAVAAVDLAQRCGGLVLNDIDRNELTGGRLDIIVNTTTWGETEASESEPLALDLEGLLVPGVRLFDLNNRVSALQRDSVALGCVVIGGGMMQRVTHASRAALVARALA